MKWLNNVSRISSGDEPGECPRCKSMDTDYAYKILNENTLMGFGVIWCNSCMYGFHMSRVKVEPAHKHIKEFPKGISFN